MSELERAGHVVVPLQAESLDIQRRIAAGDTVRVETVTDHRPHEVDEELAQERVEVTHVPVGLVVETMPAIRDEGDLMVVPVVEEQVVVTRRLVLKEEIHIRRIRTVRRHQETVLLREQKAVVTRSAADQPRPVGGNPNSGDDP